MSRDKWFGIEGIRDGHPFLIRGRESLENIIEQNEHQARLDICWTYLSKDKSLMPETDDAA
jgi:hypothetical protein